MSIPLKTPQEIRSMQTGGRLLAGVLDRISAAAVPGTSLLELEDIAVSLIAKTGGKPSFKMVPGYRWATCLNVNAGVVHGVPNRYQLKTGDVFSVDAGIYYRGFHTDAARSLVVPPNSSSPKSLRLPKPLNVSASFLAAGRLALARAIDQAVPGNRIGHLSQAIEETLQAAGFSPVRELTGHGVGRQLHEEPSIPCFLDGPVAATPAIKSGMVLAIEVIYAAGKPGIKVGQDDWTIVTADGSLAGLFEETVAVTAAGPKILSVSPC